MKEKLVALVQTAGKNLGFSFEEVHFEHPETLSFGDYSTNIALMYSKKLGLNPRDLAAKIQQEIEKDKPDFLSHTEVAGAGFINFFLSTKFFVSTLKEIVEDKTCCFSTALAGKNVLFEYTDPNPFKAFHIGHLMANSIGEALSRVAETQGAKVTRVCYQGDIGLHVAKTVWAMRQARVAFPHDTDSFEDKMRFMGDAYVVGVNAYEDDEKAREEIKEINKKLFEKTDADLAVYYDKGREWSLLYFDSIYKKLGTKFDDFIFESEVSPTAVSIVKNNLGHIFEESDGATVFKGEQYGLHTRVFLNSQGLPTYEAKDLANAVEKAKRFNFDLSIITSANEINEYFKVILKAMSLIDPENAEKTSFVGHGMLRFAEGKMSSRKGNIITGESLIKETEDEVYAKMEGRDIEENEKKAIATSIAIGAIKYTILKQSIGRDIIFDREKAISFEGDSGPYLQYALVRARSLLRKAGEAGITPSNKHAPETAYDIEHKLFVFKEILEKAWEDKSLHMIVEYLVELCSEFNSFYAQGQIVSDKPEAPYKLMIVKAFAYVLEQGLSVLAIKDVQEM